jgi:tRNA threonylcarbamoyladenosine biosynthesis protein TsaE
MKKEKVVTNEQEMISLGESILKESVKSSENKTPLVFWLEGELGAGKTYFTKGIGKALGIKNITSPTFVIVKKSKILNPCLDGRQGLTSLSQKVGKKYLFHIDCYRVQGVEDAKQVGLEEILAKPDAVVVIEWAERIADIIPKPYWKVRFRYEGEGKRKVVIQYKK